MCTELYGSATGATLSTEGRDGVWLQRNSAIISLLTVGQESGAASLANNGCEHWEAGLVQITSIPKLSTGTSFCRFSCQWLCEDIRTSKPITATPTPTHPPPWKRAQRTGQQWWSWLACTPGGRWHHRTAFTSKTTRGENAVASFPEGALPSCPSHSSA